MTGRAEGDDMDKAYEKRLQSTLTSIMDRLSVIEKNTTVIVRVEERVETHSRDIEKFAAKLEKQDGRLHKIEIWQAERGNKTEVKDAMKSIKEDIDKIEQNVANLTDKDNVAKGRKYIEGIIFKWFMGILAVIIATSFLGGA